MTTLGRWSLAFVMRTLITACVMAAVVGGIRELMDRRWFSAWLDLTIAAIIWTQVRVEGD